MMPWIIVGWLRVTFGALCFVVIFAMPFGSMLQIYSFLSYALIYGKFYKSFFKHWFNHFFLNAGKAVHSLHVVHNSYAHLKRTTSQSVVSLVNSDDTSFVEV